MQSSLDATAARAFQIFRAALTRFRCPPDRLDAAQRKSLERLAEKALDLELRVLCTPRAAAVQISEYRIREAVQEAETQCGGEEAFASALAAAGLDRTGFAAGVARELTFDGAMRRAAADAEEPTAEAVRSFFEKNTERFRVPETRTVRHILITINPDFPENSREAAKRRIGEIAGLLDSTTDTFAAVAKAHSECPTALEGGLVGTVARGSLYAEIEAAVFAASPGEVSGPVETDMGFHLVLCEAVREGRSRAFFEVETEIREHLAKTARSAAQRTWLASLPEAEREAVRH